ncbi:hypothetical protein [Pseudoprevotella muciniphila]|nr:hypothetical protein [Pseudoprevotella muciniphila]
MERVIELVRLQGKNGRGFNGHYHSVLNYAIASLGEDTKVSP